MVIKRKPGILKGIKKIVKRIEEMPFDNRPELKPEYVELRSFSSFRQKEFAGKIAKIALPVKKVSNVFKSRSKKQTPYQLKRGAIKTEQATKKAVKNAYENTGNIIANGIDQGVATLAAKPGTAASFVAVQGVSKIGVPAATTALFGPAAGAGMALKPGLGTLTAPYYIKKLPKRGLTNLTPKEKKRYIKTMRATRKVTNPLRRKSIKGAVENIKTGITSLLPAPTSPQAIPSYRLARVTM